jgi:hypothetical protein
MICCRGGIAGKKIIIFVEVEVEVEVSFAFIDSL